MPRGVEGSVNENEKLDILKAGKLGRDTSFQCIHVCILVPPNMYLFSINNNSAPFLCYG